MQQFFIILFTFILIVLFWRLLLYDVTVSFIILAMLVIAIYFWKREKTHRP